MKPNNKSICYVNTSSSSFYSNSYQTSLNSDAIYFKSNTSQLAIEVSFACSEPQLALEKSFPAKLSNENNLNMNSISTSTRLLVNQKAPCSR